MTTSNEVEYIKKNVDRLINAVQQNRSQQDTYEVVIQDDYSTNSDIQEYFEKIVEEHPDFVKVVYYKFQGDFSELKNNLIQECTGDWIVNLDADEFLLDDFIHALPDIIEKNPTVDCFILPRINTVDGLTFKDIQRWGWSISSHESMRRVENLDPDSEEYDLLEKFDLIIEDIGNGFVRYDEPIIQWPDPQMRVFKNNGKIKWKNKVHERLVGYSNYAMFPLNPFFAIRHFKTIERQRKQNELYDKIQLGEEE